MGFVYALIDPEDKQVFYIGKSSRNKPKARLAEHKYYSKDRDTIHTRKIKGLIDRGLSPEIKVLIWANGATLCHAEIEMIAHYSQFKKLTNLSEGGDGAKKGHNKGKNYLNNTKKIYQFDIKGNLIKEYSSLKEAAQAVNVDTSNISRAAQRGGTSMGFLWNYNKIHYNRSKMVDIINNMIKFN